jgi:hypothetical protein
MNYKRRNFAAILLALALSVFMVSAAFAAGGKEQKRRSVVFTAAGEVKTIEPAKFSMTLEVEKANRVVRGCDGVFDVSENVKVKTEGSDPGEFDLGLEDVEVGYYVRVFGVKSADGNCLVTRIVVWIEE